MRKGSKAMSLPILARNRGGAFAAATGGAVSVEAPWTTEATLGYALELDGTDGFVSASSSVPFGHATGFSISGWIYIKSRANYEVLWGKNHSTGSAITCRLRTTPSIEFLMHKNGGWLTASSTATAADDAWHHVACVYDGTGTSNNVLIYVNGTVGGTKGSADPGGAHGTNATEFHIGHNDVYGDTSNTFDGIVDDVRVYQGALSSSNITSIYNSGAGDDPDSPTESGSIVAHWKFDETSGTNAADETGNYVGTVENM